MFAEMSAEDREWVASLGTGACASSPDSTLRAAVVEVCRIRPWRPAELASVLGLGRADKLVARHLSPMVAAGLLERTHPDSPNHPEQAYRATNEVSSQ